MNSQIRKSTLLLTVIIIISLIYFLERKKPESTTGPIIELSDQTEATANKAAKYPAAREIANPSGFINTAPLTLKDLIGQQVILVDFWTYSCINCQRTLPYLNSWHDKYGSKGLTIVGIHTPEFEFEQKLDNVNQAVAKFKINYPVVLDNEYSTWRAYGNRYWPRKYLIDIDGFIVYDHIGEGAYEETEAKIQKLLAERSRKLGATAPEKLPLTKEQIQSTSLHLSPEIYFGSDRNEYLANGNPGQTGSQEFSPPTSPKLNQLFLTGLWNIQPEFASNQNSNASIIFQYRAKNVYLVASSATPNSITLLQDGQPLQAPGADVTNSQTTIQQDQLYHLIQNRDTETHTLEIKIQDPGLKAFTFTFG